MFKKLKQEWRSLAKSPAGHRFQEHYKASRRAKIKTGWLGRLVRIGVAVACIAIGVVLVFIPGPAILFFAIAGALLAAESLWLARSLDWLEVVLRKGLRWGINHWRKLHAWGKVGVASLATLGAGAAVYGSYTLFVA